MKREFEFHAADREQALQAMDYAACAMLPSFSLHLHRLGGQQLTGLLRQGFTAHGGFFPHAQLRAHRSTVTTDPLGRQAVLSPAVTYLCSAKQANDVICVAAEIGALLRRQLGERRDAGSAIWVYQRWINSHFQYRSTGQAEDHTAVGMLLNRSGVCQGIAALTLLVLPHLGLKVQYVAGQGGGEEGWQPHGWNVIWDGKEWIHADFTFGMSCLLTPTTKSELGRRLFVRNHRWEEGLYHPEALTRRQKAMERLRQSTVALRANDCRCVLGGVSLTAPKPLLIGNEAQGHWIDLQSILRLLGGGCEYVPGQDLLRFCLGGQQWVVPEGASYLGGPEGYFSVALLRRLPLSLQGERDALALRFGGEAP